MALTELQKLRQKRILVKYINEIGGLRKKAHYMECNFNELFKKIYGYDFDFYEHDFLVDFLSGDAILKDIKHFENELEVSNTILKISKNKRGLSTNENQ